MFLIETQIDDRFTEDTGVQTGGSVRQCDRVSSGRVVVREPTRRRPELCQTRHPEHPGAPAFHEYTSLRA
ncbi:unnamed protein product [Parnassius apollo]|uniref:(apollo) hypothetical protein n=1 Tax=Parnassius apollo TaxID=110799 RepID=A0A8S3W8P8_PARAO|nr:unnamed protein product [Parnassius apollo]